MCPMRSSNQHHTQRMVIVLLSAIFIHTLSHEIIPATITEESDPSASVLNSTSHINESGDNLSEIDMFPCPKECTCLFIRNPPHFDVACIIPMLGPGISDFSVFNDTGYPNRIMLFCSYTKQTSILSDDMFAGFYAFRYLQIKNCFITYVSKHAFRGMKNLVTLIIDGGQNTEFETECLQEPDLSNLELVSIIDTETKVVPSMCNLGKLWMVNISHNEIEVFASTGLVCNTRTNVQIIDLSNNKLHELVKDFGKITKYLLLLYASQNMLDYISPSIFTNLTQLGIVELDGNRISNIPTELFSNNKIMTILSLSHNHIWNLSGKFYSNLVNLRFLRLENTTVDDNIWTNLTNFTNLEGLYIGNNSNITKLSITTLRNLNQLQILDISRNSITHIPNGTFENQNLLQLLNIGGNEIYSIEGRSMEGLLNLTTLDLKQNGILHIEHHALLPLASLLNLNLSYNRIKALPQFPISLWLLDLRHNNISIIYKNSFTGLINLKVINMRSNKLKVLPKNVFITNKSLRLLELSHNCITNIVYQSFPENSPIEVLILNNNNITDITEAFTPDYLQTSKIQDLGKTIMTGSFHDYLPNLKTLDLSHNTIEKLVPPILGNLFPSSIEELILSWNVIRKLGDHIFRLPNLRIVDLRGNDISRLSSLALEIFPNKVSPVVFHLSHNPFDCDCNLVWLKEYVKQHCDISRAAYIIMRDFSAMYCKRAYRHPSDLFKNIPADNFLCPYQMKCSGNCLLECCSEENCPCKTYCPKNCVCYESGRMDSDVIDCVNGNLTSLPENVSPVVTTFDLSRNKFPILESQKFENLTQLKQLLLQFCSIALIQEGAFDGLVDLMFLDLGHNLLTSLNPQIFKQLTKLKTLILQNNKIGFISENTFKHLTALSYLDLSENKLTMVSEYEFKSMSQFVQLKLASNPWSCDCKYLEQMKNFTITHAQNILDFTNVTCVKQNITANMSERYSLADVHLPDFCNNETVVYNQTHIEIDKLSESAIVAMSIVLSVTFLCLIAFGVIFWKREFLKVWCFVKFGWRFTGTENKDDANRPYDAFVSYSSHDEGFIVRELAPYLEEERQGRSGYRLCVHYRDFAVGASIAESIISAVELSKRVIIVLSDNFLNSEWCQYEFQTAHHQLLEERKNRIIMVLLHNINLDMEDHQLKNYLKTRTYLKYGDPWFWPKLEYAMPKKAVPVEENMDAVANRPQPYYVANNIHEDDIALGENNIQDDDYLCIIDNMGNYEADAPC